MIGKKYLMLPAFCALAMLLNGCFWLAVGAGAGAAGAAYSMGEMRSNEDKSLNAVYGASVKALEDLSIPIRSKNVDGLAGKIQGKTADDKDVTIKVERLTDNATKLSVRVGPIPDETRTRAIYDKIKTNLGS